MTSAISEEDIQADGMFQEGWLVQRHRDFIQKQDKVNATLIGLASQRNIPLVATNDSHYIERDDWRAHEILLNIQSGEPCEIWERILGNPKLSPNPKGNHRPMSFISNRLQMRNLFADVPEAIETR